MQYMEELKVLRDSDRDACMAEQKAIRSDPTTEAGWFVKRHVDGQQLVWKIGQRRLLRHLHSKRSNCN